MAIDVNNLLPSGVFTPTHSFPCLIGSVWADEKWKMQMNTPGTLRQNQFSPFSHFYFLRIKHPEIGRNWPEYPWLSSNAL
jgi:hypothetical protein